jgi:sortase B
MEEKKPLPRKKKLMLFGALALCVCVMVGAALYLGQYYWQVFAQRSLESDLRDAFNNAKSDSMRAEASPSESSPSAPPTEASPGESAQEGAVEVSDWWKEYSRLLELEKQGMEVFADILARNPDFRGMVSLPGLGIETPYVYTTDNDIYLNRTFDGKISPVGTVFLNCWNDRLLMDRNSVLYGHNIKAGDMFAPLLRYKQAETFQKAPVVYLDGLTGETVWIIFAAYVTEPDWGYVEPNPSRAAFADMLDEIKARSWFITDVDVNEDDRILTLSTCDYTYEDMRFAVHARLLRPGEEIPASVAAETNPERKPYNIPSQKKLSEIEANRTAVLLHPNSNRMYFYQPRDGGIDWYSGNTSIVQGVYSSYTGRVANNSFIAAVYDPDPDKKMVYVAVDNFNKQKGITLLTNRLSSGALYSRGVITPPGVDAKFPALTYDDETVWLLYTVPREGGEDIYRRKLHDGKAVGDPELLLAAPAGSGARPLGCYTVDGSLLLFWHETASKKVYGAWEGSDPFEASLTGDADRVTLYGLVSGGKIRAAAEKNGKLTFASVDLSLLPKPPAQPVVNPEPEPEPPVEPEEPGPEDSPDGEGGDGAE